jgi:hypothetical protein
LVGFLVAVMIAIMACLSPFADESDSAESLKKDKGLK